ncbi:precorrin-6y C5,15-methyltransferase (decarboxylating) subunit CbiE [Leptolyngbya sp. AN02str]|uniref:precorrin-6y C5,15-methyltransferase (decarboxylating) subunit CbiE n=1 Tax=Leptolyngbya sp. AN02str TaxID=3423363 RepID=UPI003D318059
MVAKWLSVIGIGEDGVPGLAPVARSLLEQAEVVVGGARHLAMLPDDGRDRLLWSSPIAASVDAIMQLRGKAVCVLASGDPMCYGVGVTLIRKIPAAEMLIIPAPSTFSWVCARMGWSITEVETLSLCNRPLALVNAYMYAAAKLVILSEDRHTPGQVALLLTQQGFGPSAITVLERVGGPHERQIAGTAATWQETNLADLNAIAIECKAETGTIARSRVPGLSDLAYHHDGQLTKREVRAITLSALAPQPGERLWDVGAGCGSIAIEWMRSHPRCSAIAIEKARTHYIADNAIALGTPTLQICLGEAPAALADLPQPHAIFIGGGITTPGLVAACWEALPTGGRMVANVVTVQGEQVLAEWHAQVGGTLSRIAIQRAEAIGSFLGWKPLVPVTQWVAHKS